MNVSRNVRIIIVRVVYNIIVGTSVTTSSSNRRKLLSINVISFSSNINDIK